MSLHDCTLIQLLNFTIYRDNPLYVHITIFEFLFGQPSKKEKERKIPDVKLGDAP